MKITDAIMANKKKYFLKADSTIRTNGTGIFTQKFDSTMSGRIIVNNVAEESHQVSLLIKGKLRVRKNATGNMAFCPEDMLHEHYDISCAKVINGDVDVDSIVAYGLVVATGGVIMLDM